MFEACIISKLVYGLVTTVLNQNERRRLDGFQARCIRRILKAPYTRISNERVLKMAARRPLSEQIMKQQMILMGKIVFSRASDVVRQSIFIPSTIKLRLLLGPTKRGRLRIRWPVQVLVMCIRIAGSYKQLLSYWHFGNSSFGAWRSHVRKSSVG